MARAVLAYHDKQAQPDGTIVELKIWDVPAPVAGSVHRHIEGREEPYAFTNVEQLIADFLADVRRASECERRISRSPTSSRCWPR